MQEYITQFNGARPFRVSINNRDKTIIVYNYEQENTDEVLDVAKTGVLATFIAYDSPCFQQNYEVYRNVFTSYWIGKSSCGNTQFDGNTILIHINEDKYVFIGECIYSFISYKQIISYVSDMGNSNVPYPYAVDEDRNIYLMIEDIIMYPTNYGENTIAYKDPYNYYYNSQSNVFNPIVNKEIIVDNSY